jgi:hypothetical protein
MNTLSLRRDPFRLALPSGPWASAWYLFGYQFVGWLLFAIAFTAAVTGAALSVTLAGLPVLVAPLAALDLAVLTVWLVFLAGVTLPVWYWAPRLTFGIGVNSRSAHGVQLGYFPNGPHGHPGYGLYVDTLPKALLAAAVFLVAFLLFNYVLVATARAHAAVVRALLGSPEDPLREAREVLRSPGPLRTFIPNGHG